MGTAGFFGVGMTVWQRTRADRERTAAERRAEWWRRTQWAIYKTAATDNDPARAIGWAALQQLVISELISSDDRNLLTAVATELFGEDNQNEDRREEFR